MRYYDIKAVGIANTTSAVGGDYLKKPTIVTSDETNVVIEDTEPSTAYVYNTLSSLTINNVTKSTAECTIEFTAAETFIFEVPASLQTVGEMSFVGGKKYILAIYNNIMAIGEMN